MIKTSSSESRPRKVELASTHKNVMTTVSILHITTKLVETPIKQPYHIYISSLSTLVLNSRDRYEKKATEFYAPENTP